MDGFIYNFIGFSFSVSSTHTYSIHIPSSTHFICSHRVYYFASISLLHPLLVLLNLHHHSYIITYTLLNLHQLHHYNLITLQALISYYTIQFNYILYFNFITTSLWHSINLSMTIHLRISTVVQFSHLVPTFLSPFHKYVPISISNDIWDTSKLLLLSGLIQGHLESTRIWFIVPYALQKLIEGLNKIRLLRVQRQTVIHDVIKPAMV